MKTKIRLLLITFFIVSSCTSQKEHKIQRVTEIVKAQDYEQYNTAIEVLNGFLVEDPFNMQYITLLVEINASIKKEYQKVCLLYSQMNNLDINSEIAYPWLKPGGPWEEWVWWYPVDGINKLKQNLISSESFEKQKEALIERAKNEFIKKESEDNLRHVDWYIFDKYRKGIISQSKSN